MRLSSITTTLGLLGPAAACIGHVPRDKSTGGEGTFSKFTLGVDNFDIDPATTGYFTNHFSLNVKNLTAMMDFYTNVFGMRHLFTLQMTEHYSLSYIAHASGGSNSSGFQTVTEMNREKNHRGGRIELQFHNDPAAIAALTASTQVSNTFSHIGLIVPDLTAALTRFEALGVKILSKPGDVPVAGSALFRAYGASLFKAEDPETQALIQVFTGIGQQIIMVEDPDGNLVEVLPRNEVPVA